MRRYSFMAALLALTACHHRPPATPESLASQGQILPNAPFKTTQQITINAPPAKVWALLTGIQSWPAWHNTIVQTASPADVTPGTLFSYDTEGMTIRAAVQALQPERELAWTGQVLNFRTIEVWTLRANAAGGTDVTVSQSVSGFLIGFFYSEDDLVGADQSWLRDLKVAAET